jgi:molybdopterin synthase sulfur carrier subunit
VNTYHIHYFGLLADKRGISEETILHSAATPAALYQDLLGNCLARFGIRAAVNDAFVAWEHPLANNDNIAFLPPMSGG